MSLMPRIMPGQKGDSLSICQMNETISDTVSGCHRSNGEHWKFWYHLGKVHAIVCRSCVRGEGEERRKSLRCEERLK